MKPSSYLEHIDRLKEQNKHETDPALKRENEKTIRHLYAEYRKKTKHQPPAYAFIRFVVALALVVLLIEAVLLGLGRIFGYTNTAGMTRAAAILFVIVTVTVMLIRRIISPEVFAGILDKIWGGFASLSKPFISNQVPNHSPESKQIPSIAAPEAHQHVPPPTVSFDRDNPPDRLKP